MTTISAITRPATSGPCAASATTAAMASATGDPMRGMKAAKNSSTASGTASGTPRRYSATPTRTAFVAATSRIPRVYPVKVCQAARPAIATRSRVGSGSWAQNHAHCRSPPCRKKTEQKTPRARTVRTCTRRPAPLTAWLSTVERWLDRYCPARAWTSERACGFIRKGGRSSHSSMPARPWRNSRAKVVLSPATASPTSVSTPSRSSVLPRRQTATAGVRGMARSRRRVGHPSSAAATRPRKTATAISWNRPSTAKIA